jgi:hypothetical protein
MHWITRQSVGYYREYAGCHDTGMGFITPVPN